MTFVVNIHRQQGMIPAFLMTSPDISSSPPLGQSFHLHNYRKLHLQIVMKVTQYIQPEVSSSHHQARLSTLSKTYQS